MKNKVQNVKNNNLQARPSGIFNYLIESNKLLHDITDSNTTYEEALKRITNIRDNITTIINQKILNLNQTEVVNTFFMVDEVFTGKTKMVKEDDKGVLNVFEVKKSNTARQEFTKQPNEQPDTTTMPDLESDKSADLEGEGLKILPSSQMLSRLLVSLPQLEAENNSEKLKNEFRQLLYSLYRSEKLTINIYKSLIDVI